MATLEHELTGQAIAPASDPHVFAAATGRRAGVLRVVGLAAGVLALAWLAALALSLLGAGSLPGLLPEAAHGVLSQRHESPPSGRPTPAPAPARQQQLVRPAARVVRSAAATTATAEKASASHSHAVVTAPVTPAPAAPTPAQGSRGQGWARRGWSAPPGQTHRSQPPAAHGKKQTDGTKTPPGQSASHAPPKKG